MNRKITILCVFLLLGVLFCPSRSFGLMESDTYTIFADDFNSGQVFNGGDYRLENTLGESPVGLGDSVSYDILGGYQAMDHSSISIKISVSSLDLGTLSRTSVSSASTTIMVTTDSDYGYVLSLSGVSGSSISSVSDGSVTAGSEEYGFSAEGDDVLISGDVPVAVDTTISSTSTVATDNDTALTFKASISSASAAATYNQTLTFTVSNNL